jgi:hypothetical protein
MLVCPHSLAYQGQTSVEWVLNQLSIRALCRQKTYDAFKQIRFLSKGDHVSYRGQWIP